MAKKHSRSDGTAAKSEHKAVKVVAVLIVILAVAYVIAALALGRQWNPVKWIKKDKPTNPTAAVVAVSDTGEAMYAGGKYAMPRAMTVTQDTTFAPTGEFTLTAELTNEYINGVFEWSAAWVNASSEWATGKNVYDYCEMSAATDGSGGAAFNVKAPFAEQITISAKLVGTESVGTCTVDYLKRLSLHSPYYYGGFGDSCYLECDSSYGVGTVQGDITLKRVSLIFDDDFIYGFKSALKFDIKTKGYAFEINNVPCTVNNGYCGVDFFDTLEMSMFIFDYDNFSDNQKYAICYAFDKAYSEIAQARKNNALIDFEFNYSFGGVVVDRYTESDIACLIQDGVGNGYWEYNFDVLLNGGYVV